MNKKPPVIETKDLIKVDKENWKDRLIVKLLLRLNIPLKNLSPKDAFNVVRKALDVGPSSDFSYSMSNSNDNYTYTFTSSKLVVLIESWSDNSFYPERDYKTIIIKKPFKTKSELVFTINLYNQELSSSEILRIRKQINL